MRIGKISSRGCRAVPVLRTDYIVNDEGPIPSVIGSLTLKRKRSLGSDYFMEGTYLTLLEALQGAGHYVTYQGTIGRHQKLKACTLVGNATTYTL